MDANGPWTWKSSVILLDPHKAGQNAGEQENGTATEIAHHGSRLGPPSLAWDHITARLHAGKVFEKLQFKHLSKAKIG